MQFRKKFLIFSCIALLGIIIISIVSMFRVHNEDIYRLYEQTRADTLVKNSKYHFKKYSPLLKLTANGSFVQQGTVLSDSSSNSNIALSSDAQEIQAKLVSSGRSNSKALAMAAAFDALKSDGTYTNECIIGLMANIENEGSIGTIENKAGLLLTQVKSTTYDSGLFRGYDSYDPQYGDKIETYQDVLYFYNAACAHGELGDIYTTKSDGTRVYQKYETLPFGLGMIQWTYGRAYNYIKTAKEFCEQSNITGQISEEQLAVIEVAMILKELDATYFSKVKLDAEANGGTAEAWAEAYTDFYEICAGSCHSFGGRQAGTHSTQSGGSAYACIKRRKTASDLVKVLTQ